MVTVLAMLYLSNYAISLKNDDVGIINNDCFYPPDLICERLEGAHSHPVKNDDSRSRILKKNVWWAVRFSGCGTQGFLGVP
jgi:hypothetical protein